MIQDLAVDIRTIRNLGEWLFLYMYNTVSLFNVICTPDNRSIASDIVGVSSIQGNVTVVAEVTAYCKECGVVEGGFQTKESREREPQRNQGKTEFDGGPEFV